MTKARNVYDRKLSNERTKSLSELADRIDREEATSIQALGRRLLADDQQIARVVGVLKHARTRKGLTLADVDERTGMGRSNLSRLENQPDANPTLETLLRYAEAVGVELFITAVDKDLPSLNSNAA